LAGFQVTAIDRAAVRTCQALIVHGPFEFLKLEGAFSFVPSPQNRVQYATFVGQFSKLSNKANPLNQTNRLSTAFNIHAGEGKPLALFIAYNFFVGLAQVLTQTVAFALFIDQFGAANLPFLYLATALGASLFAFIYLKIGARLHLPQLLLINLGALLIISLLFRFGLSLTDHNAFTFLLPVWFQIVANFGILAVWTLASRLFDVRQAKRLFGLIGSGNWIAITIGGFAITPIVALLGTANLLLLAAASLLISIGLQRLIVRGYGAELYKHEPRTTQQATKNSIKELIKPRYVKLILALISVWWIGFFFVDNIFYDRAAGQFANADQLASFLGTYFIITGFIGLITTTFLSGPIISRFGLRAGLAIMPVLLLIGIGLSAILGTINSGFVALFWLIAVSKSLNVALGFSIAQSGQIMLYQPLAAESRGRIQTFAEGIIQPIAIGVAAVLLLLFNTVLGFHAIQLSYLFLIIGAIWLVVIVLIMHEYPQALSRALAKRNLGETTLNFADKNYLDVLRTGLRSPFPASAIYSLNLLARTDRSAFLDSLSESLWHPAPEVRREALTQIEQMLLASATPIVRQIAVDDPDVSVRADALRTLTSIGDDGELKHVAQFLADPDRTLQRGALIGLLRYSYPESIQKLVGLIQSPNMEDRILAAQVLGEARRRDMDIPLPTLLRDPEPQVRRAALNAIGHIKPLGAWPDVIAALDDPHTRSTARLALMSGGELALPAIQKVWDSGRASHTQLIALGHVAGHIGGHDVIEWLQTHANYHDHEVRTSILNALAMRGYRISGHATHLTHQHIKDEAAHATWALAAINDLGNSAEIALLVSALQRDVQQARDRIFFLLSFFYDSRSIMRARDAINFGKGAQRAYGLDLLDTLLIKELKAFVLPLADELALPDRLKRLTGLFPQTTLERDQRLRDLIEHAPSIWTKACTVYTIGQLRVDALKDEVVNLTDSIDSLMRDAAQRAYAQFEAIRTNRGTAMLSTIERVIILKAVGIFEGTPDEVLADIAALLEEESVSAGQQLFAKGDRGDSLYIVIDGKLQAHDGDYVLNDLIERDVFGEMALLDPEPRSASVTAVEDSQLFRLDQIPFYDLMADRAEVARGIIRVLTQRLRGRMRDLNVIRLQNQEPEKL
jgi:ATP/ADP translocase